MKVATLKRLASDILGVGVSRIHIVNYEDNLERIKSAVSRMDVQSLIQEGVIKVLPEKGKRKKEKRKKRGPGSRKGSKYSRFPKKKQWMIKIRALRRFLRYLIENGYLAKEHKKKIYMVIKGGHIKGKKALLAYLYDNGYIEKKVYEEVLKNVKGKRS